MPLLDFEPLVNLDPKARALVLAQLVRAELVQHRDSCWTGRGSTTLPLLQSLGDILSESVSIVRSLANASGPIGQLPNEILSSIFELIPGELANTSDIASFGFFRTVNVRDILALTAVCRWWRRVAFATPLLWSTVCDSRVPDRARQQFFHARYAGGPLSVFCDNVVSDFTLDVLQTHRERVQQLYVFGSPTISALGKTSPPNLKHCIIRGVSSYPAAPLSPLFSGESVRLRSLTLHSVCFLPSSPFPSLTHLMISKPTRPQSGALYTTDDLLDFILGSPLLRELHLYRLAYYGVGTVNERRSLDSAYFRLDHLEKLCILEMQHSRGYPLQTKLVPLLDALLPRILFPDTCAVRIGQLQPSELQRCLQYLGPSRRATRMCIESEDEALPRQRRSLVLVDAEGGHYTRLDVSTIQHEGGYLFYLLRALALPIFQDIREVYTDAISGVGWPSEVFATLPYLEVFALRPGRCINTGPSGGKDHVGALKLDRSSGAIICPRLSTLVCGARSEEDEAYVRELAAARTRAGLCIRRLLVWQEVKTSVRTSTYTFMRSYDVREYNGEGDVVGTFDGEEAEAVAVRAWATTAPPGCPDWMEGQMYHPSVCS